MKTLYPQFVLLIYYLFISIFILLTRRKATEALIRRVSNYPDLLPKIPRYCSPLVVLIEIDLNLELLARTTKQGKCLSQGHNRMVRVGFERRPCWSRARCFDHSTTLPTNLLCRKICLSFTFLRHLL